FLADVAAGDTVIVDGNDGLVILDPDEATLARYQQAAQGFTLRQSRLGELRNLPAVTRDGVRVALHGNIEFPHETAHCLERGAEGVGLYRTEFLYLDRKTHPSEE